MNIPTKYLAIGCMALFAYQTNAKDVERKNSSPAQFIHNAGQITNQHGKVRTDIDFKIANGGVTMFGGKGQLHYQWTKQSHKSEVERQTQNAVFPFRGDRGADLRQTPSNVSIYRMDVTLVGANKNAEVIFEESTGYYENYYLAHTGENGVVAKGYSKVTYKNVYPGIDWVIYTPPAPLKGSDITESQNTSSPSGEVGRGVKYDFIIHPGGNPADIRLRYDGATELKLVDGALVAVTPYGTITEDAPYSYNAATKAEVTSNYLLTGNELRFDIAQYKDTLVIDPTLDWASYFGGSGNELSYALAADTAGNSYMGGLTASTNNIATTGSHQNTIGGGTSDGYIAKYTLNGQRAWATYYGGSNADIVYALDCDPAGNVYFGGFTFSTSGIATTGAHQDTYSNSSFFAKLNANGVRQWASYYASQDIFTVRYCKASNSIYIGGSTNNTQTGIATAGSHQPARSQGLNGYSNEGFIAKFTTNGVRQWGTYYGGIVNRLACDAKGNIYVVGRADTNNIATAGTFQTSMQYMSSGYLAKFNGNGVRQWGTYYTSNDAIDVLDVTCDADSSVYICGRLDSVQINNILATTGSHQPTFGGRGDGFITKFSHNGQRQWCTFYGGTNYDYCNAIFVGPNGHLYVKGATVSLNNIATPGSHKTTTLSVDGFVAIFTPTGQRLWASYFGGDSNEDYHTFGLTERHLSGIAYNYKGKINFCGSTVSTTGLATNGAAQTTLGGSSDAYIAQFNIEDTVVYTSLPITDSFKCSTDTLKIPYGVTRNFNSNNTFTFQLSNSSGSFATPANLAVINGNTGGTANCFIPLSVPNGNGYRVRVVASSPADTSLTNGFNIRISSYPANFSAGSNSPLCTGDTLKLNSGTTTAGIAYAWAGPNSYSNTTEDPVLPNATLAMAGNYYITLNNNGCAVKDTVTVVVNQTPENVTATNNGGLCTGDTMKLMSSTTTGGVTYAWAGPNNYNTQNVTIPNVQLSHAGTYIVTVTLGNCSDTASTTLTVDQSAVINIVPLTPVSICKGDTAQFSGFPNFAGTNPLLQWQINGVDVPNANGTVFKTPLLVNGDKVRLEVTPNTTCPGARVSNEIAMTVQDLKAPQVAITADAGPSLYPNEPINFTAVATDAGNAPNYQWRKNGIDIGGATGAVWGANANALKDGDNICVSVTSTYACPSPDTALSNCIQLDIRLSVDEVVNNNSIKVYPNPVKGTLRITSTTVIETITINNLLGQQLLQQDAKGNTADVDMSALAAGVYVVKVNGVYAVRVTKE